MLNRRRFLQATSALTTAMSLPLTALARKQSACIEALLQQMTLDEKVGQLTLYPDDVRPTPRPINPDINAQAEAKDRAALQFAEIRAGRVGALLAGTGVELGRQLQEAALTSRLRIPRMFGADLLHGFRTIFPLPLALASSFEPQLAQETARSAARKMTAVGVHWTYAPMVNVARDQRWGRVAESSGEDPYLSSRFAEAYVRGFQDERLNSDRSVVSCPKHFAGYGAALGGKEYNTTDLTERELRQTHLPPFKAAFDAGALTTMAAFNDLDGVTASGNRHLLTNILRTEMGFNGFVVSDAESAEELVAQGYTANEGDAAKKAFNAGLDVNMGGGLFKRYLPALVTAGAVTQRRLDEAVRRVLAVKEQLGLFDDPFRSLDADRERTDVRTPAALALARKVAVRSIVLLKNDNDRLPLAATGKVALIGPLADDAENVNGAWAPWAHTGESITLAHGIREALGAARMTMTPDCGILDPLEGGVTRAVATAQAADVVILALGEAQNMSGEAAARADIVVPAAQQALAEAVAATGKPLVIVLSCGRALALEGAVHNADAILVTWFLGSEGGRAIADILTGKEAPSGRLPVNFPQLPGRQPWFYNHKSTGRPQLRGDNDFFKARYLEISHAALFPFGHGLSFSKVEYGASDVDQPALPWHGTLTVSTSVRNTGTRQIEEVVQLWPASRGRCASSRRSGKSRLQRVPLCKCASL